MYTENLDSEYVLTCTQCTQWTAISTLQEQYTVYSSVVVGSSMRAVLSTNPGPPSVLYIGEADNPAVGVDEVLIKVSATAVNRADTLQRKGLYPVPVGASSILGLEAAGEIVHVGSGVTEWQVE